MKKVTIVEVGLRDGLQTESTILSVDQRLSILQGLADAGLKRIEIGGFVRPDRVPQMAGTREMVQKSQELKKLKKIKNDVEYSVLVPNMRGWQEAAGLQVQEVALFASSTESFSQKNINCSIDESFQRFIPVIQEAKKKRVRIRGYLSVCFGCPFEGEVPEKKVVELVKRMAALKIDEVSIGDTIGVANVSQVRSLFKKLKKIMPAKKLAGHFHDTRGQALVNILAAFEEGISIFDTSIGGLGGCPYAPGSTGNVATEDTIYMFEGMKIKTGVDLKKMIELDHRVGEMMNKKLPSRVARAGLLKPLGPVKK